MGEEVWLQLCGDKSFKILDEGCLSECFEELCLHVPCGVLLLLVSSYWAGEASVVAEHPIYRPRTWSIRLFILLLLLLQDIISWT